MDEKQLSGLADGNCRKYVDRNYELVKNKLKGSFPRLIRDREKTLYKSVRRFTVAVRMPVIHFVTKRKKTKAEKYDLKYIKQVEDHLITEESKLTRGDFVESDSMKTKSNEYF